MILGNIALTGAIVSWFLAQTIKVILVLFKEKRMNFRRFIETGGMPSSHTSFVVTLTTIIGRYDGVSSTTFAISSVFALIVMYDASGLRRAAGKQAKVLNRLVNEFYKEKPRVEEHLKELLGHTPVEVVAGALLGVTVGVII